MIVQMGQWFVGLFCILFQVFLFVIFVDYVQRIVISIERVMVLRYEVEEDKGVGGYSLVFVFVCWGFQKIYLLYKVFYKVVWEIRFREWGKFKGSYLLGYSVNVGQVYFFLGILYLWGYFFFLCGYSYQFFIFCLVVYFFFLFEVVSFCFLKVVFILLRIVFYRLTALFRFSIGYLVGYRVVGSSCRLVLGQVRCWVVGYSSYFLWVVLVFYFYCFCCFVVVGILYFGGLWLLFLEQSVWIWLVVFFQVFLGGWFWSGGGQSDF